MSLNEIIEWLREKAIRHLCLDSRSVERGDVFVVLAGATHDGSRFIPQAIERGATAFLIEAGTQCTFAAHAIDLPSKPYLIIPALREKLSLLASVWYAHPSESLRVIGITGTNGKTSSAQWIAQGLEHIGTRAGSIGTLGCTGLLAPPKHDYTTPDVLSLHRYLSAFRDEAVNTVALEVSSHALDQHRVDDVAFHTALFTNLSRDHLDYHSSLTAYGEAKARLFEAHRVERAVINIDDPWGEVLAQRWKKNHSQAPLLTYGLTSSAELRAQFQDKPSGLELKLKSPYGSDDVYCPHLNGRFNVFNLLGIIGVWMHLGLSWSQIVDVLPSIQPVPGRMNKLGGSQGIPTIMIDYAHTPDALENVLSTLHALRDATQGKLWCVMGAGGDRDPGKRPLMGQTASRCADRVVITNDNPRTEDPVVIAQQIFEGIPLLNRSNVVIELDRRQAIEQTLNAADSHDIILISGKGHELYQELNGVKMPFSDRDEVANWIKRNVG
jgi:UDP-N-acetylmuramoyl-L-alanyl-D-glutamate--2,6-diaminopimelate ligase